MIEGAHEGEISARHNLTGALCVCGGAFAVGLLNVIVKSLSGNYPLSEFLVIRALAALPIMAALVLWEAGFRGFRLVRPGIVFLRGAIFLVGTIAFGLAISQLAMADTVSIYFIMPLVIAGLSGPLLGERVPDYRWVSIAAGFVGVMIIMSPGAGVLKLGALIAFAGAIIESFGQLTPRFISANRTSTITFYQFVVALLGSLALALVFGSGAWQGASPSLAFLTRPWIVPAAGDLAVMIVAGPLTALSLWLYVHAYKVALASFIAPFDYTSLFWAALFGFVVFGDVPTAATGVGATIVMAAGLFMLRRDRAAGLV